MAKKQTASGGRSTSDQDNKRRKSSADQKPTRTTRKTSADSSPDPKKKPGSGKPESSRSPRATGTPASRKTNTPDNTPAHRSRSKTAASASKSGDKKALPRKSRAKSKPAKSRTPRATKRPEITKRISTTRRLGTTLTNVAKTVQDPAFWQGMVHKLPPWTDEVVAILLIVSGVVMFTALLNTASEAMLSVALSRILRQIFGYGAYLVALSVMAAGTIILLPKFGTTIVLGWTRLTALEIAFGSFTALLHLLANDPESRVLAREGKGGGFLGWALMQVGSGVLGHMLAIGLFVALLLAGLVMASGLRLRHALFGVYWLRGRLQRSITRLESIPLEPDYGPDTEGWSHNVPPEPDLYAGDYGEPPVDPEPRPSRRPSIVPRGDLPVVPPASSPPRSARRGTT